jgi:hypothetical protein
MPGMPGAATTGGGWLGKILGGIGGGIQGTNPVAMGAMGLLDLGSKIFGAIQEGKRRKKSAEWMKTQQTDYKNQLTKLFPELSREQMTFKNPYEDIVKGALGYRLGNMFADWGMPAGRNTGAGSLNDLFAGLMPQQMHPPIQQPPNMPFPGGPGPGMPMPGGPPGPGMGGGMPTGMGGIMGTGPGMPPGMGGFPGQGIPRYATGGIVTQPQMAMIGEAGPEAIVPLNQPGMGYPGYLPPTQKKVKKVVNRKARIQPRQMMTMQPPRPPVLRPIQPYNPMQQMGGMRPQIQPNGWLANSGALGPGAGFPGSPGVGFPMQRPAYQPGKPLFQSMYEGW